MPDYVVELLHPGWFRRRAYRTSAGIYGTLNRAQRSIPYRGWKYREWRIGKYGYPMWECEPFGSKREHAWWRITTEPWIPLESPQNRVNSSVGDRSGGILLTGAKKRGNEKRMEVTA